MTSLDRIYRVQSDWSVQNQLWQVWLDPPLRCDFILEAIQVVPLLDSPTTATETRGSYIKTAKFLVCVYYGQM